MEQMKKLNEILPRYSFDKRDELSIISYKICKLENEIRILKELKEEIRRERDKITFSNKNKFIKYFRKENYF